MDGNNLNILKSQRWAMLTNEHFPRLDTIKLLMSDLAAHKKDLKALVWSVTGVWMDPELSFSTRQLIEQCWARFYKDFYLN